MKLCTRRGTVPTACRSIIRYRNRRASATLDAPTLDAPTLDAPTSATEPSATAPKLAIVATTVAATMHTPTTRLQIPCDMRLTLADS
jgi:hypothetical protein